MKYFITYNIENNPEIKIDGPFEEFEYINQAMITLNIPKVYNLDIVNEVAMGFYKCLINSEKELNILYPAIFAIKIKHEDYATRDGSAEDIITGSEKEMNDLVEKFKKEDMEGEWAPSIYEVVPYHNKNLSDLSPEAKADLDAGLESARRGEIKPMGSFTQYINDGEDWDDIPF